MRILFVVCLFLICVSGQGITVPSSNSSWPLYTFVSVQWSPLDISFAGAAFTDISINTPGSEVEVATNVPLFTAQTSFLLFGVSPSEEASVVLTLDNGAVVVSDEFVIGHPDEATCTPTDGVCSDAFDCCSGNCVDNLCAFDFCLPAGAVCGDGVNAECCDGEECHPDYHVCASPCATENPIFNCEGNSCFILQQPNATLGCTNYTDITSISWLIQSPTEEAILLSFDSFDTEFNFDFVRVFDGSDANATLIGEFSGTTLPGEITSSNASLLIIFTSDGSVQATGFAASYVTPPPPFVADCNATQLITLTALSDSFGCTSYSDNITVEWLITSAGGSIFLEFDEFNTEGGFDFVNLYDGPDNSSTLLGSFSGNTNPGNFTSTGDSLFVEFETDGNVTADGFIATYTITPFSIECNSTELIILTAPSDSFGCTSHGNNITVEWLIISSTGEPIYIEFDEFNTEGCCDFVTLFDGPDTNASVIGSFSGSTNPGNFTSSNDTLLVVFATDGSVTEDGFIATYTLIPFENNCTSSTLVTLTDPSAIFGCTSHVDNLFAQWLIVSSAGGTVFLNFDEFNTEGCCDFVNLYDGPDNSSTLLGSFSGNGNPGNFTSTGDSLFVEFDTDGSVDIDGFVATYTIIPFENNCTSSTLVTLTDPSDTFGCTSHADNLLAQWLITSSPGGTVFLNFDEFNTEGCCDFVSLFDGPDNSTTLLGSFSGDTNPGSFSSTGDSLFVEFDTDGSVDRDGFVATYTLITP